MPGANPTIASYNASAVKIYTTTSSLVRFENKNVFFYYEKRSSLLQRRRCGCKLIVVGLTPALLLYLTAYIGTNLKASSKVFINRFYGVVTK
jgi:hypothetical protein